MLLMTFSRIISTRHFISPNRLKHRLSLEENGRINYVYYSSAPEHCMYKIYKRNTVGNVRFQILISNHYLSGFIDPARIQEYGPNREKYLKKGKGIAFQQAVGQMDEYISDPIVIHIILPLPELEPCINVIL